MWMLRPPFNSASTSLAQSVPEGSPKSYSHLSVLRAPDQEGQLQ